MRFHSGWVSVCILVVCGSASAKTCLCTAETIEYAHNSTVFFDASCHYSAVDFEESSCDSDHVPAEIHFYGRAEGSYHRECNRVDASTVTNHGSLSCHEKTSADASKTVLHWHPERDVARPHQCFVVFRCSGDTRRPVEYHRANLNLSSSECIAIDLNRTDAKVPLRSDICGPGKHPIPVSIGDGGYGLQPPLPASPAACSCSLPCRPVEGGRNETAGFLIPQDGRNADCSDTAQSSQIAFDACAQLGNYAPASSRDLSCHVQAQSEHSTGSGVPKGPVTH